MRIAIVLIFIVAGGAGAAATSRRDQLPVTLAFPGADPLPKPLLAKLTAMRKERGAGYKPRTRHLQPKDRNFLPGSSGGHLEAT